MPKSNPVTPNKRPPEDWNELVAEFQDKRGSGFTKTFIRKLWAAHEDILTYANPSLLRMMFISPALTICSEGVQLVAEILLKIGVANGMALADKQILKFDSTDAECERHGRVFTSAWIKADADSDFDLTEEMESDVVRVICQNALFAHKPFCAKYRKMLLAFAEAKIKKHESLANMITRILGGCLYRALESTNYVVQSSALDVFFTFFPLVAEEGEDVDSAIEKQLRYMSELVSSDIVPIRTEAVSRIMKALGVYWTLIAKDSAKQLLAYIIDKVSRDSVVGVRVAVYDGLSAMAFEPATMNVFEHGFKCAAQFGVLDSSERVRLAAYQCLARMKHHKFISCFDILPRDEVIAVLDLENVEDCRKQLIPVLHIFLPISENLDEAHYRPRVNYLLAKSRIAVLSYFRLLGPMKIIEPKQAAKLIEMFLLWAYRYLRKKDQGSLLETSDHFRKARSYLECGLIIYMSCKRMLMFDCEQSVKAKLDQTFGKIAKHIFENFGNTPLLGTATAISSVIPKDDLKSVAADVLARLADDEVPEEALEPFLESAIHFNPDSVFDSLINGLNVFNDFYEEQSKQSKKKKRDVGDPDETLTTTLRRLKYTVQSHSTSSLLASNDNFKPKFMDLMKKVDLAREAIDERLKKKENDTHTFNDENLLLALEFRFILPLYAVSESSQNEKERKDIIESTKTLLLWFQNNVAPTFHTCGDHNQEFFIKLSSSFLNCICVALSAYDFKTRPVEYEDEEDEENRRPEEQAEEEEDKTSVAELISQIVRSFANSSTPMEVLIPALRVAAVLCEESYSETHEAMIGVLRFTPKWLFHQFNQEEDKEFSVQEEKDIVEAIRQLIKKTFEIGSEDWTNRVAKPMVNHFLVGTFDLISRNMEDTEYEDPRSDDYKPNPFVSLVIIKLILKDKILVNDFFDLFANVYLPEDGPFFAETEDDYGTSYKLSRLAALSFYLRLLERHSKTHLTFIKDAIQTCTDRVLGCFASATDMDTVPNCTLNSLAVLLDVHLPDGS